ncbi:MAG: hypothetical protein Q6373_017520 [Candidatus Sigynarchaeota archaeon]
MKKFSLILTTINVPLLIKEYIENFSTYGWKDVEIIIIGDVKSNTEKSKEFINNLRNEGNLIHFFSIAEQEAWMKEYPKLSRIIPYNSDNRRNVGYLIALQHNADVIINIDDDNYPTSSDFIRGHSIAGENVKCMQVKSSNGWFNSCSLLENDKGIEIYPRGYPYSRRFEEHSQNFQESSGKVAINMGLWINDPDVDAITHLAVPLKIRGFKSSLERLMIDKGTFCPINSQNTAVARRAMVAYYFPIMGANLFGTKIDRFGDIWQGCFAKKIIDAMDERVVIGTPLVNHRRNKHDYLLDLQKEMWGIVLNEKVLDWLISTNIENRSTYADAYLELVDKFDIAAKKIANNNSLLRYFHKLVDSMRVWVETCERIGY